MSDPLKPFVSPETPAPQAFEAASAKESPFAQAIDEDSIIKNLMLDRPLKLIVPDFLDTVNYDYGFCNSTVSDMTRWKAKGWLPVDNTRVQEMFAHLHGGTDARGKEFKMMLMARPKKVSAVKRRHSQELYIQQQRDMHPSNKSIDSQYARIEKNEDVTRMSRTGLGAVNRVAQDARSGPINAREHMIWDRETGRFVTDVDSPGGITSGVRAK